MSRSLAQQKIDLAQKRPVLSPEEEEAVRLGMEDFEAGRYVSFEETLASMREGIAEGLVARTNWNPK